ncbi:MAG: site-2 protease family protein [Hormoscilla sp. GM102CHS1]|nr:site-2 protease family protein [Hormoscilla sp. GM102CHS1]
MFTTSENPVTALIVLAAAVVLVWGLYRSIKYGKLGILAWLQSVVLIAPWLLFFGLFGLGIYINLATVLFLIVASAGLYIYLGKKMRAAGTDSLLQQRRSDKIKSIEETSKELEKKEAIEETSKESEKKETAEKASPTKEIIPGIIPAEDIKKIQDIFGVVTFFATETIPYQEGAIFKGNLRGEPAAVYQRLSASLSEKMGDRYRLFLVENPEGRPVAIVLPSRNDPQTTTVGQKILAVILALATIVTSLAAGGLLQGFDIFSDFSRGMIKAGPIAIGIWAVLLAHEIGHRLIAKRYEVRIGWPFFLPTWQIGSFGSLNRFESLLPNRQVLFDVAIAGPAAGGILSLGMLIAGLLFSHPGSLFQVPSQLFQGSILVGTLARVVMGSALGQQLVDVHPLTIIGWIGLVITAINLMPAGQLDGGRIVQAIYGRKVAGLTTIATLIVLAIASLANPLALYWAALIVFLQRDLERPSLNEITEPDDQRAALALLALFLMLVTLIPLSSTLAGQLLSAVSQLLAVSS